MITLKKLATLKEGTRQRKYVRLLRTFEEDINSSHSKTLDQIYLRGLYSVILEDESLGEVVRQRAGKAVIQLWDNRAPSRNELLRASNDIRHLLLKELKMDPGDWDLLEPIQNGEGVLLEGKLPINLYLDDIRSPFNVGSIFRTAEAMGVNEIFVSPHTASPLHKRAQRSAMGAVDLVPWSVLSYDNLDMNCFALELGGLPPGKFSFPPVEKESCIIIGSEELGVSPEGISRAEDSYGRVSLPMRGQKGSLNVAVATGIILYHWTTIF